MKINQHFFKAGGVVLSFYSAYKTGGNWIAPWFCRSVRNLTGIEDFWTGHRNACIGLIIANLGLDIAVVCVTAKNMLIDLADQIFPSVLERRGILDNLFVYTALPATAGLITSIVLCLLSSDNKL